MDIVDDLLKEKSKREKIFKNYTEFVKKIKEVAKSYFGDVKVYVFGSAVRGNYHVMLSDIDVAVVTNCKDYVKIYSFKAEIFEKFEDVFEIHVVDERTWKIYKKFIDALIEI
ncbi:nucleotidyltransferase domain-containing protein [Archaeoglobus sp.]